MSFPRTRRWPLLAFAAAAAGLGAGACDGGDDGAKARRPPGTTTTAAGGDGVGAGEDASGDETPLTAPNVFSGATTEAPVPAGALDLALSGTVSARGAGDPQIRCLTGDGFFDVDVQAEPPLPVGGTFAVTAMSFGAPRFRGPGTYDAAAADDAEWSVAVVDVATGEPSEYFSPLDGVAGSVTVAADGRSGRFDIRGLTDADGAPLSASGAFTCGVVEG